MGSLVCLTETWMVDCIHDGLSGVFGLYESGAQKDEGMTCSTCWTGGGAAHIELPSVKDVRHDRELMAVTTMLYREFTAAVVVVYIQTKKNAEAA